MGCAGHRTSRRTAARPCDPSRASARYRIPAICREMTFGRCTECQLSGPPRWYRPPPSTPAAPRRRPGSRARQSGCHNAAVRIDEVYGAGLPAFSFEFFPPRTAEGVDNLFATIAALRDLGPAFVSVTYGAGGSTRELTLELVERIKRETGIEAVAHLTCVGSSTAELEGVLDRLADAGLENVLAL